MNIASQWKDQFEKLSQLQRGALEAVRNQGAVAVDSFERLARHNYDVLGDIVDHTVTHVQELTSVRNPRDLVEKQVAGATQFARAMGSRASEYVELLTGITAASGDAAKDDSQG